MRLALTEARKGQYFTAPNPNVGCVIVKDNKCLATGYHERYGAKHAEISALEKINFSAKDCDLYVTLEPCAHHGKTPPCVNAIIAAGIRRVIIPFLDPNPQVSGAGISQLQTAGITVISGILTADAKKLNRFFLHYMSQRRPFVIAKWAMSSSGHLQLPEQQWLTAEPARAFVHLSRQTLDGILIGANTLRHDNPQLTTRSSLITQHKRRFPWRIVMSSNGNLPTNSRIFQDKLASRTIVACLRFPSPHIFHFYQKKHVQLFLMQGNTMRAKLLSLLEYLAQLKIMSLMIEGGKKTLEHWFRSELINECHCYVAQSTVSPLKLPWQFITLKTTEKISIGPDLYLRALPQIQNTSEQASIRSIYFEDAKV